jgi:hypothetical protein
LSDPATRQMQETLDTNVEQINTVNLSPLSG